jgi:hypothetical protein
LHEKVARVVWGNDDDVCAGDVSVCGRDGDVGEDDCGGVMQPIAWEHEEKDFAAVLPYP